MKERNRIIMIVLVLLITGVGTIFLPRLINKENQQESDSAQAGTVTLAHDKGWVPTFQENFTRMGERAFSEIGIGIKAIPSDTTELYIHQMKATLPTAQAPDLFTWWSTYRVKELVDRNLVGDLSALWKKHWDEYPKGLRDAFTLDGKMYGFPYGIDYWPVWYNKDIFKQLELKEPANWTEFIHVCDTLKAAGITPILSTIQYKWPAFIWFEEMIIGQDPDLYEKLCRGMVKYTDPRIRKAFTVWQEMINNSYFSDPSANMMSNGGYLWQEKKHGMVLCGTWYYQSVLRAHGVNSDSIGAFILPSHNPEAGRNIVFEVAPIFTSQNGRNPDAAVKIADWWMGQAGAAYFTRIHATYPGNSNVSTENLPPVKEKLIATIRNEKFRVLNRFWEATPVEVGTPAVEKLGEFMMNPDSLDEILAELQEIADQYWSSDI
nr:ABC transporter substrate-binding protein [uncultured Desulfobacter sp.]